MTHLFFDSSALIKRYIPEPGTGWVRSQMRPGTAIILVAAITQVEVVSGVMRRKRDGHISQQTARALRVLVDLHLSREYMVVGLNPSIIQQAEDALEKYALRAYDSIQLASAIESNTRLLAAGLAPLTFISADNRLLTAAHSEGLAVDDPNLHP